MHPPSVSVDYDDDFFAWTQDQATALRGIPSSCVGNVIDLVHVAEEIEDLGKRELREVKSLLARLIEHLIKIAYRPNDPSVPRWRAEALVFQRDARNAYSPGMLQYLDLDDLWRHGRRVAVTSLDLDAADLAGLRLSDVTVADLLTAVFDLEAAVARITPMPIPAAHR